MTVQAQVPCPVCLLFRDALQETKPKNIHMFTDSREVEIIARVGRVWTKDDEDVLDREAVKIAEVIMKVGWSLGIENTPSNDAMYKPDPTQIYSCVQLLLERGMLYPSFGKW